MARKLLNGSVGEALAQAEKQLRLAGLEHTPAMDATLLMEKCLGKGHAWQLAHADDIICKDARKAFLGLVNSRAEGVPVAYLTGEWGFWTQHLKVNESVLVPRPETELIVERVVALYADETIDILDLGTGSGAIALAIASELVNARIVATDASESALEVARHNATENRIQNVSFRHGSWFKAVSGLRFDVIVCNPPYVAANDPLLAGSIRFEPPGALVAGNNGLADLEEVIVHASSYLLPGGRLLVEHGFEQGDAVRGLFGASGFGKVQTSRDLAGLERMTEGVI